MRHYHSEGMYTTHVGPEGAGTSLSDRRPNVNHLLDRTWYDGKRKRQSSAGNASDADKNGEK